MQAKLRTFMYASIGILALTLAWSIGYQMAAADVNPAGSVHAVFMSSKVLGVSGECYDWSPVSGWARDPRYDSPVPVGEIG